MPNGNNYAEKMLRLAKTNEEKKDSKNALKYYKKADSFFCRSGEAAYRLAKIYFDGNDYVDKSEDTAVKYLRKAAKLGYADALLLLGDMYLRPNHIIVGYNEAEAIKLFEKVANGKNLSNEKTALGDLALGDIYSAKWERGEDAERSLAKAIMAYEKAVQKGNADAMLPLALFYLNDKKKESKAVELLEKASENGNWRAWLVCSERYFKEQSVALNTESAETWFRKSTARWNKSLKSFAKHYINTDTAGLTEDLNLGSYLEQWHSVASNGGLDEIMRTLASFVNDEKLKFDLRRRISLGGSAQTELELAKMYHDGKYVEKNMSTAISHYEAAAKLGSEEAMLELTKLYRKGQDVKKDEKEAFKYCEMAAMAGSIEAMFILADMYYQGSGVVRNEATGNDWQSNAENSSRAEDLLALAEKVRKGVDFERSHVVAFNITATAAKQGGNGSALRELGKLHLNGLGTAVDKLTAAACFEDAQQIGDIEAMRLLGEMYEYGNGVERSTERARQLYQKGFNYAQSEEDKEFFSKKLLSI